VHRNNLLSPYQVSCAWGNNGLHCSVRAKGVLDKMTPEIY
jgi:hypothetical protein